MKNYPIGSDNEFAPWNQPIEEPCEYCDGDGYIIESCCGDNIKGNDIDLCPTCLEHCGTEHEICEHCNGTGIAEPIEEDFEYNHNE